MAAKKLVYIASPYAGDIEANVEFARAACRYAIHEGMLPFAPHLLYPQVLDDAVPKERELGIELGIRMLKLCDELWLCGERLSEGMAREMAEARRIGIPVRRIDSRAIMEHKSAETFDFVQKGMRLC